MTPFQQTALLLTALWLVLVAGRFRRSIAVLVGGLAVVGLYTLFTLAYGRVTPDALGLGIPDSWLPTVGLALGWLALMLAYSPLADRLATRWFAKPPTLESFGALRQSRGKLIVGFLVAWALGGILEELVARGIVLRSVASFLAPWLNKPPAAATAVLVAALGAGLMHFYQGARAVVIITQLSILFGVLFVLSGYNLWAVMLCHGLYDTVAFIRFAARKSSYADLDQG